ncbi:mitochondrial calcium uniporter regulator 1-like [Melopsittacus undulatus]|uniref:mitochondrial calcium uniporter regulator 1-like n=1 Tax=Melopsittacus undulatus TaxID=13146 RepID=UPI00146B047B|nr:mitochondrial calcium uniporter regulator 1-like [Melopsittacus undulatus]
MAKGQAAVTAAVSGGRRALLPLLPLRPRGAPGAASRDCRAPPFPVHRCLGDWQRLAVTAANGSAGRGRPFGGTGGESRCGERGVSTSASPSLQSRENVSFLGNRRLFFDTHALVCLLEQNGFTTQQSEVIVSALVKIMNTNLDMIYKDMVTKVQQEIALQQVMSHIGGVKKDMIILEKSEFSALRSENEKIKLELQQIKKEVMDEIAKVRADNKLNLNLEKTRVKELYSRNERKLLEMRTEIVELHAQQDRALTQTDRKIDTEVADLKTMLETHKLDNIKYLAGSVFTCLTVALGFYRLWR